jgi:hypothetical protein
MHCVDLRTRRLSRVRSRERREDPRFADLELAIGVDQEISRLEVSMEDVGRVNVLEAAKSLVEERLEVGVRKGLV